EEHGPALFVGTLAQGVAGSGGQNRLARSRRTVEENVPKAMQLDAIRWLGQRQAKGVLDVCLGFFKTADVVPCQRAGLDHCRHRRRDLWRRADFIFLAVGSWART